MKISVVRPGELGPGEIAVWLSMQRQTPALANPFLCPDFTVAVGALRPSARVAVLHDGPRLAGFFPFERRGLGVGTPIGHGLNQCQGLIHAPGAEWDPKGLLRACRLSTWQFDNLVAGQRPLGPLRDLAGPDGGRRPGRRIRAVREGTAAETGQILQGTKS